MKLNILGSSLLLCLGVVSALNPFNIGKVQDSNNANHQFIRRDTNKEAKSFNVTHTCFGDQCKKVFEAIDKLTNTLSNIIQVKNQIKINVVFGSHCQSTESCNMINIIGFGKLF
jgi:hypothetical protein